MLPTWFVSSDLQKLRHQIQRIIICWNMSRHWLPHHKNLPHYMITNWVTLLPQSRLWMLSIVYKWQIFLIDVWSPGNWNSHHPQHLPQALECFRSVLHRHKLRTKTDVSISRCFLDSHWIKAIFMQISNPVLYLRMGLYPSWSLSTYTLKSISLPLSPACSKELLP